MQAGDVEDGVGTRVSALDDVGDLFARIASGHGRRSGRIGGFHHRARLLENRLVGFTEPVAQQIDIGLFLADALIALL